MDVINSAGASLNPRHIEVLVDTMTFSGNIMSIDRFGINRSNYGPIAKASFEEMTDQLYRSAIFGEIDECNGVSANVLFGQESNCGTGMSDLLFDELNSLLQIKLMLMIINYQMKYVILYLVISYMIMMKKMKIIY